MNKTKYQVGEKVLYNNRKYFVIKVLKKVNDVQWYEIRVDSDNTGVEDSLEVAESQLKGTRPE